jgi:hypothetical protein
MSLLLGVPISLLDNCSRLNDTGVPRISMVDSIHQIDIYLAVSGGARSYPDTQAVT